MSRARPLAAFALLAVLGLPLARPPAALAGAAEAGARAAASHRCGVLLSAARSATYWALRAATRLRYRVEVLGLDAFEGRGVRGALILANHPAYVDPPLLLAYLGPHLQPRPFMDASVASVPLVGQVARAMRPIQLSHGHGAGLQAIGQTIEALRQGDNVLFYPAGQVYRGGAVEHISGKVGVRRILDELPEVPILLARTHGLAGTSWGYDDDGEAPDRPRTILRSGAMVLANGVFFVPKRDVRIELSWADDTFPRAASSDEINDYLNAYYAVGAPERSPGRFHFLQRRP
jgi:hypothetical protein